jgi:hypothetical protein
MGRFASLVLSLAALFVGACGAASGDVISAVNDSGIGRGPTPEAGTGGDGGLQLCSSDADCPHSADVEDDTFCAYPIHGGCGAQGVCVGFTGSALCESGPPYVCDCAGQTVSLASLSCGLKQSSVEYVSTPIPSTTPGSCPGDGG